MSQQITEAFVTQFRDGITLRAQQMGSRLRGWFRNEPGITGTSASFDFVGKRTPTKRSSRHADTKLSDTPHDRRWVDLSVYDDADLVDKPDLVRTLTDPTNVYSMAMAMGMGRKMDEIGLAGAVGSTRTGVEGDTSAALPAAQDLAAIAALNFAALQAVKLLFDAAEQPETRYWAITATEVQDLLSQSQIQSIDTNALKPLVSGEVAAFMGFLFNRVEPPIIVDDGTNHDTVAWAEGAVLLGFGADVMASIDPRPDKNMSTQIFYSMDLGACRMDDTGVVRQPVAY